MSLEWRRFLECLWATAWMRISSPLPCRLQLCCYITWRELEVTSWSFYSRHSVNIMPLDVYLWDFLISLLNNKDKPWPIYCLCSLSCAELIGEMCWSLSYSFLPFALGTVSLAYLDPRHVCDPVLWMGLQLMSSENAFCACNAEMSRSSAVTSHNTNHECSTWNHSSLLRRLTYKSMWIHTVFHLSCSSPTFCQSCSVEYAKNWETMS